MKNISMIALLLPIAAHAVDTCPAGYIAVEMPDVEIADSCPVDWTDAGTIEDCNTGAGVCAVLAQTCPQPGYYLKNDECTICEVGYYCLGNNSRIKCSGTTYSDKQGLSACISCPKLDDNDEFKSLFSGYWNWTGTGLNDAISICRANCSKKMSHGSWNGSCSYGLTGYTTFESERESKCALNATCDAGYWIDPSQPEITNIENGIFWTPWAGFLYNGDFCVPVGRGYYSAASALTRAACPKGTFSRGTTAASAAECEPLCDAGATQFHAGNLTFNMYPNDTCESPAIRVGLAGGTCCVHLAPGAATDAVNIEYEGKTYHTTN